MCFTPTRYLQSVCQHYCVSELSTPCLCAELTWRPVCLLPCPTGSRYCLQSHWPEHSCRGQQPALAEQPFLSYAKKKKTWHQKPGPTGWACSRTGLELHQYDHPLVQLQQPTRQKSHNALLPKPLLSQRVYNIAPNNTNSFLSWKKILESI